jgi:hypothetical protein
MNFVIAIDRLRNRYQRATQFEQLLSGVRFYRFDWSEYVPSEEFDEELNPSFSKASIDVNKCRGFWTGLYKSLVGESDNFESNDYNLFNVISQSGEDLQSVIQFVSMTKKQMGVLETIAIQVLGDYFVPVIVNGDKIKGKESERYIKDKLIQAKEEGKHVWVISSQMCQRSFSIPEINTVILSYDRGDQGATIQKMSRALTSGSNKTLGHIVSLSIDGNRDEKISTIIMETAEKESEDTDEDMVESIKKVLRTLPIFQMVDGDIEPIDVDDYAKEVFESSNSHRLIVDREKLIAFDPNDESFNILTNTNFTEVEKEQLAISFKKGRTFKKDNENGRKVSANQRSLLEEMKDNLIRLSDRLDITIRMVKSFVPELDYDTFLTIVDTDEDVQETLQVTGQQLDTLIKEGYLKSNLISVMIRSVGV